VPSPEWKRTALGEVWYPGETIIAGIGQGHMLATPLAAIGGRLLAL
jgi:penicillin-binding protein 2